MKSLPSCMYADGLDSLPSNIIMCLNRILPSVKGDSQEIITWWIKAFWIGLSLLQTTCYSIFQNSVILLTTALEQLDNLGAFGHENLVQFFLRLREELCPHPSNAKHLSDIDSWSGVSFSGSMSFSLVTLLVRGLKVSIFQRQTANLLFKFLELFVRYGGESEGDRPSNRPNTVNPEVMAIFIALYPYATETGEGRRLFELVGLLQRRDGVSNGLKDAEDSDIYNVRLLTVLAPPSSEVSLLVASLAISMLEDSTKGSEKGNDTIINPFRDSAKLRLLMLVDDMSKELPEVILTV
jgi:hypothetical protein